MKHLEVSRVFQTVSSGDGQFAARKVRSIHFNGLLDPLIGFDHFELTSDVFGPHPHAGMSAITYLFEDSGHYHNLDSSGTDVVITPGSLMWTWAGRGIVHTEFPVPEGTRVHGMQVFVNTAALRKQHLPQALFIDSRDIPVVDYNGVTVKVIAGRTNIAGNRIKTPEALTFLDITIGRGRTFQHDLPAGWTATIYVLSGEVADDRKSWVITAGQVLAMGRSDQLETLSLTAVSDTRLILLGGQPLSEPIFSAGAMAMSSEEELGKAISDFEEGRMGFIRIEGDKRTIVLAT
ncbi:MAG: pirin family protein [Dyadobacter sp.]|uniref:pirin family protein n=1 Tax=Dyadobacter sp. TaxID=1914288 RepID=UPI001B0DBD3D|nr:pirin-like C-terminal cupin domain-containing protein [Dyadobacter sp.]MBO9616901.1 pirin family protein [Dyadobacter sp.]